MEKIKIYFMLLSGLIRLSKTNHDEDSFFETGIQQTRPPLDFLNSKEIMNEHSVCMDELADCLKHKHLQQICVYNELVGEKSQFENICLMHHRNCMTSIRQNERPWRYLKDGSCDTPFNEDPYGWLQVTEVDIYDLSEEVQSVTEPTNVTEYNAFPEGWLETHVNNTGPPNQVNVTKADLDADDEKVNLMTEKTEEKVIQKDTTVASPYPRARYTTMSKKEISDLLRMQILRSRPEDQSSKLL